VIDLVPHRSGWKDDFRRLAALLRRALGDLALRIDHVGSTAIPTICAKDIIDIQVTVADLREATVALRNARFIERADIQRDHVPPGHLGAEADWSKTFFTEPMGVRRTNVHVREADKPNQRYALLFRDYLLSHPNTAEAYGELKRRLANSLADANDYADVKDPAVDLIYFAAEEWACQTGWQPQSLETGPCSLERRSHYADGRYPVRND
jgi:GrpB-like predicted nucleotidyltransferase (UPF0157 family)